MVNSFIPLFISLLAAPGEPKTIWDKEIECILNYLGSNSNASQICISCWLFLLLLLFILYRCVNKKSPATNHGKKGCYQISQGNWKTEKKYIEILATYGLITYFYLLLLLFLFFFFC